MPALLIAFVIVAGIQPGLALAQEDGLDDLFTKHCSEADNVNRFELCNACRPMGLMVGPLGKNAKAVGLTMDRLQVTAESRLRAARLYTEDYAKANHAFLYVKAGVSKRAFGLNVKYLKSLYDPVSGRTSSLATTWESGSFGTHGDDPGFIVQSLSEHLDKFLVEYLRVNEEDCPR